MSGGATFVLCIENNAIRAQALLLCESIRRFAGRHRTDPIVAVAPRPGLGVDAATRARLDALAVEYVEEPLNEICPVYGSANRVYAAAWAERHARSEWIVVLDSDTVFLDEPELPAGADAAARPIDVKGSASAGPGDPLDAYWASLAALRGVAVDCLPFVRTTVDGQRVRASYNGGLIAVRRHLGILGVWADLFSRSVAAGLKPWRGSGTNIYASTGLAGLEASEYWGSNQAAAALALWSTTRRVVELPDCYNMPLHSLVDRPDLVARAARPPVHVHYHWVFTAPHCERALATLNVLGVTPDRLDWLHERLPLE